MDGRAYYKLSDGKLIGVSNRTDRKVLRYHKNCVSLHQKLVSISQVIAIVCRSNGWNGSFVYDGEQEDWMW